MVKKCLLLSTFLTVLILNAKAQNPELVDEYIKQFKDLAMSEQARVGIPAAVTLAQGIHETGAGTSRLAKLGNNHFGIKCKRGWKGQTIKHTDDRPNECFRKYSNPIASYKDHSNYLRNNPRYGSLFKLSMTDYAAWCIGLRRAGYATNPRYAQMLIKIIERYKLQEYTYAAMGNNPFSNSYAESRKNEIVPENDPVTTPVPAVATTSTPAAVTPPVKTKPVVTQRVSNSGVKVAEQRTVPVTQRVTVDHPPYGKLVRVNGLRAVYAKEGDAPLEYAVRNSIRYRRFLELNDLKDAPLASDMYLYLERKHFRGVRPMHMVRPGENMHIISQKEGIQLRYLRELNLLANGDEPVPGVTLELQKRANEKPRILEKPKPKATQPQQRTSAGYVRTNKSPIPTNPRYVPQSNSANAGSAIKVTTSRPTVRTQPVAKKTTQPAVVKKPAQQYTKTEPKKNDGDINALKKQFDDVIYNKESSTKKPVVQGNPRYVSGGSSSSYRTTKPAVAGNPRYVDPNSRVQQNSTNPTKATVVKKAPVTAPATVANKASTTTTPKTTVVTTTPSVKPIVRKEKKKVVALKPKAKKKKKQTPPVQKKVETKPVAKQEPKNELDRLKAQFDAVVYDKNKSGNQAQTSRVSAKPNHTAAKPSENPAQKVDPTKYYTVKDGDTAFGIAKKHNITMRQLMDWNDLNFDAIKTGMKLRVKK